MRTSNNFNHFLILIKIDSLVLVIGSTVLPESIDELRQSGERYLVSQTFRPGINMFMADKLVVMFCQYSDPGFAEKHLQAVRADRYAAIIDLEGEKHLAKVQEMLAPESPYLVFSNLVRGSQALEELLDKHYASRLRCYIDQHTT